MKGPISWVNELAVKDGKLETFRAPNAAARVSLDCLGANYHSLGRLLALLRI
jgi:hypothetical protein